MKRHDNRDIEAARATAAAEEEAIFKGLLADLEAGLKLRTREALEAAHLARSRYLALARDLRGMARAPVRPAAECNARRASPAVERGIELALRRAGAVEDLLRREGRYQPKRGVTIMGVEEEAGQWRETGEVIARDADLGPTVQTLRRQTVEPVQSLWHRGHLDDDQLRAAAAIRRCYEAVTRPLGLQAASLLRTVGDAGRGGGDGIGSLIHDVYRPWIARLGRRDAALVLEVVVDGVALDAARRRRQVGWARGLAILRAALDLWRQVRAR